MTKNVNVTDTDLMRAQHTACVCGRSTYHCHAELFIVNVNGTPVSNVAYPVEAAETLAGDYRNTYRRGVVTLVSVDEYRVWAPEFFATITH